MEKILLVDDEKVLRYTFREILESGGHAVTTAADCEEAERALAENEFDLVVTDIILGGRTGIDLLRTIRELNLACPVIVLTGYPDVETAAEAVRLGAFNYLSKPVSEEALLGAVRTALTYRQALKREAQYKANLEAIFESVGEAIITVDGELRIIEVNNAARLCGLSRDHIGKRYDETPRGCSGGCTETLKETVRTGKPAKKARIECHMPENPAQVVSVTASPLRYGKRRHAGAVMIVSDETRLDRLERDLMERKAFRNMVGVSSRMQEIYRMIEHLSEVDTTVLLTGESGTGKELAAAALHEGNDKRRKGPFVAINCAAIPENLIESELFGHEKGAFTGAVSQQRGKFEAANGGTIMLDEIGDMPLSLQAKLLRVLEYAEFHRVGGNARIRVDVRVIASTNSDLKELVKQGSFREDLYYRLKVIEIAIPPLRERLADIKPLTEHFLRHFNGKFSKNIIGVSTEVERVFMNYPWPGNVREMRHVIEHAAILCENSVITLKDLPADLKTPAVGAAESPSAAPTDEAGRIHAALEKTRWNRSEAARILGVDRSTLYRQMKRLGLE